MPEPLELLKAMAVASAVAGGVLVLLGWPWRSPSAGRVALAWPIGLGAGWFAGCWLIPDLRPDWPPAEDLDRLLQVVLPVTVLIETIAGLPRVPRWAAWLLRLVISFGAARVLLHGSVYLDESVGGWTAAERWRWLGGLGAALFVAWALLSLLDRRRPGPSLPLALAVTAVASAAAVMLSGYATGGLLGLPLAAALIGAALASCLLARPVGLNASLGVGIVGLFSLLVIGRFFGELSTLHAAGLFFAPLLCWAPELPWRRGLVRVVLVALLVAAVLFHVMDRFNKETKPSSESTPGGIEDYMNFGK